MEEGRYKGIVHYREETKYHYRRYARSLGHMDWDATLMILSLS